MIVILFIRWRISQSCCARSFAIHTYSLFVCLQKNKKKKADGMDASTPTFIFSL